MELTYKYTFLASQIALAFFKLSPFQEPLASDLVSVQFTSQIQR